MKKKTIIGYVTFTVTILLAASERGYYYVTGENMLVYFEIESGDYA